MCVCSVIRVNGEPICHRCVGLFWCMFILQFVADWDTSLSLPPSRVFQLTILNRFFDCARALTGIQSLLVKQKKFLFRKVVNYTKYSCSWVVAWEKLSIFSGHKLPARRRATFPLALCFKLKTILSLKEINLFLWGCAYTTNLSKPCSTFGSGAWNLPRGSTAIVSGNDSSGGSKLTHD